MGIVSNHFSAPLSPVKKALAILVVALVCVPVSQGAAATHRANEAGLPASPFRTDR